MSTATAEEVREAAQSLADALGLSLGAIQEDPSGDPIFTDGLIEVIGEDACNMLRDVRIALEEDEDDDELAAPESAASSSAGVGIMAAPGESASAASSSGPSSGVQVATAPGESASAASSSGPSSGVAVVPAPGELEAIEVIAAESGSGLHPAVLEGKRVVSMHGLNVEYTGFTAGPIMRVRPLAGGDDIGVIHQINKVSLTATCRVHTGTRCVCWVTRRERPQSELEDDMAAWLQPATLGITADEHFELANQLKVQWGMKPKEKRKT